MIPVVFLSLEQSKIMVNKMHLFILQEIFFKKNFLCEMQNDSSNYPV